MADDVVHVPLAGTTGLEGVAVINAPILSVYPSGTQQANRTVSPTIELTAINDQTASGQYVNRFDDLTYYSA